MATLYASTTGSGSATYSSAQTRATPATLARAFALHLSGDRIECELGTYGAIGSNLLGGTDAAHKTTLATVDAGVGGKALFQVSDGSSSVFIPNHDYIALENLELSHGDAATLTTVGQPIVTTDTNSQARFIDLLGCKIGNTRNIAIQSKYGPTPSDGTNNGTPGLNDSGWRILGCEVYRANVALIVAHGTGWEIGDWTSPVTGLRTRSTLHWWGDSSAVATNLRHAIQSYSRGIVIHHTDFYNNEAVTPSNGTISQRSSGMEVYSCTFHDMRGLAAQWYDNQRGKTRIHDNKFWNIYAYAWFFDAATDTAPPYTWAAGSNPVDDITIVKNTIHLKDTTIASNNAFDLSSAAAAYLGVVEIADNTVTGNYIRGVDTGTHTFTANSGVTGTLHEHHNIWCLDATATTTTTAIVQAQFDPQGSSYDIGVQYGIAPDALTSFASAGTITGTGQRLCQVQITGLTANTVYYYRFKATPTVTSGIGTGSAIDPTTLSGLTTNQIADMNRELAYDASGRARPASKSNWTVGALESTPGTSRSKWQPTIANGWAADAVFLRTKFVAPIAADGGTLPAGWAYATGTGSGNSKTDPWTMLQAIRNYIAGDDIVLAGGNYHAPRASDSTAYGSPAVGSDVPFSFARGNTVATATTYGTATNPVRFRSEDPNNKAVIKWLSTVRSDEIVHIQQSYMIFDSLEFDGNLAASPSFVGNNAIRLYQTLSDGSIIKYVAVLNCYIHDTQGGGIATDQCDYVRFDSNVIWNHRGVTQNSGISLNMRGATVTSDGYDGFHNYILNNIISGCEGPTSDGNGIILDNGGGASNVPMLPTLVANNICFWNGNRGIHVFRTTGSHYVVHNTCSTNGLDGTSGSPAAGTAGEFNIGGGAATFANCIANPYQGSGSMGTVPFFDAGGSPLASVTAKNLWYVVGRHSNSTSFTASELHIGVLNFNPPTPDNVTAQQERLAPNARHYMEAFRPTGSSATKGISVTKRQYFVTAASGSPSIRHISAGGSDAVGTGADLAHAYKTLGKALSVASAGDTILCHGTAGAYNGETLTATPTGLIRIDAAGDGDVRFANLLVSAAKNLYFGPGIKIDGHGKTDDTNLHGFETIGTDSTHVASDIYFAGSIDLSTFSSSSTCIRLSIDCQRIHFMNAICKGGGYAVKSVTTGGTAQTDLPNNIYFINGDFSNTTWDIKSLGSVRTARFYDCINYKVRDLADTAEPTGDTGELHDSLQIVDGSDILVEGGYSTWNPSITSYDTFSVGAGNGVTANASTAVPSGVKIQNHVFNGWNGAAINATNITNLTVTGSTAHRTPGISTSTGDIIAGYAVGSVTVNRHAPLITTAAKLTALAPPQAFLKQGVSGLASAYATAVALAGPLFKDGGVATHLTGAGSSNGAFGIVNQDPTSAADYTYTTDGTNRSLYLGSTTNFKAAVKTGFDAMEAAGSAAQRTLIVYGTESWKSVASSPSGILGPPAVLPNPSHFSAHADAVIDALEQGIVNNGGLKYWTHVSVWNEMKGRVNLGDPTNSGAAVPSGWLQTGLPSTAPGGGAGTPGTYIWESDSSFDPDTYTPNAPGVGAASDTNYQQYYAWAYTKFYNVIWARIKGHTDSKINTIEVGGPHLAAGGIPNSTDNRHKFPLGDDAGTITPYVIDYSLLMYWMRWSYGFDFISIDYSIVDNGDSTNANTAFIVANMGNWGTFVRRVKNLRDTAALTSKADPTGVGRQHSAIQNLADKRAAAVDAIEFYYDVALARIDTNYAEDTQAMQEALVLRELWTNGVRKAYKWMPEGDNSGGTLLQNKGSYWRAEFFAATTNNSSSGLVTNTGSGTKYLAYDAAKLFVDNFGPGTQLYTVTSTDSELVCMASASKVLVINTNTTSSKTFTVEGVSQTLAAKGVAVYSTPATNTGLKVLGNIFHQGDFDPTISSPTINLNHWVEDRTATNNKGTNFTTGNPLFVNGKDLHLQSGTPATARTITDSDFLVHDVDGVGRGTTPVPGAYRGPSVVSAIPGAASLGGFLSFRFNSTTYASLSAWQAGGTIAGFAQGVGSLNADPLLGLSPSSPSTLVAGTYGAPDFWPQSATGPTVNTGSTIDDTGLTPSGVAFNGHYSKYDTATDIGASEYVPPASTAIPTIVQEIPAFSTVTTGLSHTTGTLATTPKVGNTLLLSFLVNGGGTITDPAGWTRVGFANDSTTLRLIVYKKTVGYNEPKFVTINYSNAASTASKLQEWNGDVVAPIDTPVTGISATTGTAANPVFANGLLAPAVANELGYAIVGWQSSNALTAAAGITGTTWTASGTQVSSTGGTGTNVVSLQAWTTGALSTTIEPTFSGSISTARKWGSILLAIRPKLPTSAPNSITPPVISPSTGISPGTILSTTTGSWSDSPTGFTYQWKRNGTPIGGATTSSYTVLLGDGGATITVSVTASNDAGSNTATSGALVIPNAPLSTVDPGISGTTTIGSTLIATTGTWTDSPSSFAYQWKNDGVDISGATSNNYVIGSLDLGHIIRCVVTATNSFGSNSTSSNSISIPSSAYGQGPAVVGFEIMEWIPSSEPTVSVVSDLRPVLFPISPLGMPIFSAQALRMRTGIGSGPFSMALYSYSYSSVGTFTATKVGQTASISSTGPAVYTADLTGAPIALDFTQNNYMIGIMTSAGVPMLVAQAGAAGFGVIQFTPGAIRASATDWPATFTQASVASFTTGTPWSQMLTPTGKWFL